MLDFDEGKRDWFKKNIVVPKKIHQEVLQNYSFSAILVTFPEIQVLANPEKPVIFAIVNNNPKIRKQ